jgi:hypothetical protein
LKKRTFSFKKNQKTVNILGGGEIETYLRKKHKVDVKSLVHQPIFTPRARGEYFCPPPSIHSLKSVIFAQIFDNQ